MQRRSAFTIVELLVSMALIIFIMVILSNAFYIGTDTFRRLKAIGDMQEKLRSTTVILQADLNSPHFSSDSAGQLPLLQTRLSDIFLSAQPIPPGTQFTQGPPGNPNSQLQGGFFRIWQGFAGSPEGVDSYGNPSSRAYDHMLHFTVYRGAVRPENYFSAYVPGTPLVTNTVPGAPLPGLTDPVDFADPNGLSYRSKWAEVVYFCQPTGATANGTPLFALYRRQVLLVPGSPSVTMLNTFPPGAGAGAQVYNPVATPITYYDVNVKANAATGGPTYAYFNGPGDVTIPENRFSTAAAVGSAGTLTNNTIAVPGVPSYPTYPTLRSTLPVGNPEIGDDILLTDVVSFDVKVRYDNIVGGTPTPASNDFIDLPNKGNNPVFNGTPGLPPVRVFDTWSQAQWIPPANPPLATPTYDYLGATPATPVWATATDGRRLPLEIIVRGVQITIRIWDSKSEQTRQITIVQDM